MKKYLAEPQLNDKTLLIMTSYDVSKEDIEMMLNANFYGEWGEVPVEESERAFTLFYPKGIVTENQINPAIDDYLKGIEMGDPMIYAVDVDYAENTVEFQVVAETDECLIAIVVEIV